MHIDLEAEENPMIEVTFDQGRFAGRTFRSVLSPCMEVTCQCGNFYLEFDADDGDEFFDCTLDTIDEDVLADNLSFEEDEDREEKDFVEQLCDELIEEHWQKLSSFYLAIKAVASEVLEPDVVLAHFDVAQTEGGMMQGYNEILPYALPLLVEYEGEQFEIADSYCLKSNCSCTSTNLHFVQLDEDTDLVENHPDLQLSYDYRNEKAQVLQWPADYPCKAEQLLNVLGQQLPELQEKVKARHERLRAIYRSFLKRMRINPNKAWAARSIEAPPKLAGRNDPCPCGSGKKYKKCCGA
jgi:hypothetical protein